MTRPFDTFAINPVLRQPKWRYVPGMYLVEGPGFDKFRIRITADDMAGLSEYDHESDIWIGPREISRLQAEDRLARAEQNGARITNTIG